MSTQDILKSLEISMYKAENTRMDIDRGHPMVGLAHMFAREALINFLAKLDKRFRKFV
jgi:hypothetical protein